MDTGKKHKGMSRRGGFSNQATRRGGEWGAIVRKVASRQKGVNRGVLRVVNKHNVLPKRKRGVQGHRSC